MTCAAPFVLRGGVAEPVVAEPEGEAPPAPPPPPAPPVRVDAPGDEDAWEELAAEDEGLGLEDTGGMVMEPVGDAPVPVPVLVVVAVVVVVAWGVLEGPGLGTLMGWPAEEHAETTTLETAFEKRVILLVPGLDGR